MMAKNCKITLIGAGNVATHLGKALKERGFLIQQVYSRTLQSAKELGLTLNVAFTNDINYINKDADIYIFSVKDSALPQLLQQLPSLQGLLVHTAGSLPLDVFNVNKYNRYGVLYPLQTFSKNRVISFQNIPIFVEANNTNDESLLLELASHISDNALKLSSEKRKQLHLAAVFACNFVNDMYVNAADILERENLSKDYLLPLIKETASKIKEMHPRDAQTGPAVRYDTNVINKHLELLKYDSAKATVYKTLSDDIHKQASLKGE
ncbi:putative short-subunit dehydrogenase-like oxidoreductase (DUF2520 family) [Dysgonomonadaceae bacterium PH5-43]|nr:putative short-subunit dehydrogenase-like oxidoreductase (DUF2520 family) [Dysgonomonadaceae bacterium PH5-43]